MAYYSGFAEKIVLWYHENKRDLPWRRTKDPYKIWLSEIILQQTRVKQGLPYYHAFIDQFPTVKDLANAEQSEVLRVWQGLGYYSRARNLHACAIKIVQELDGKFPPTYKELLKLPGIGPYTAAAIASFAFGEKTAVVDGNVLRVLSRFLGVSDDIVQSKSLKNFREIAEQLAPEASNADYNQGIMEFGAKQCTPGMPDCGNCVLYLECYARQKGIQRELPVKSKKIKSKVVHFTYFVFQHKNFFYLNERTESIWQGLYDFHLVEDSLPHPEGWLIENGFSNFTIQHITEKSHVLSHREIKAQFIWLRLDSGLKEQIPGNLSRFTLPQIEKLPKPILIEWYLQQVLLKEGSEI